VRANHLLTGRSRVVVIKTRVVRHSARATPLTAHLNYLRRDGVTRAATEGSKSETYEKAHLFGPGESEVDGQTFAERADGDRHHFRFIVSPEDAADICATTAPNTSSVLPRPDPARVSASSCLRF
jgi:type IV secretory pathway VirD2 relaxase